MFRNMGEGQGGRPLKPGLGSPSPGRSVVPAPTPYLQRPKLLSPQMGRQRVGVGERPGTRPRSAV